MDDWGNLIYILAAAVFGIYNAVSKKKKKKDEVESSTLENKNYTQEFKPSFSEMLETLVSETGTKNEEQDIEPIKIEDTISQIDNVEKYNFSDNDGETPKKKKKRVSKKYNVEELEDNESEEEEIDWRQAILYSEILNRKYN